MRRMKDGSDKGIISEARGLYEQMSGEAGRLVELDRKAARRRGPVAEALLAACFIAVALAVVTLVYGFITFPDAPIRESANGYAGKHGAPHAREHYERFKLWEKAMLASFGLAFVTGFGAVAAEKLEPKRLDS
jgi:hypothetical protein